MLTCRTVKTNQNHFQNFNVFKNIMNNCENKIVIYKKL